MILVHVWTWAKVKVNEWRRAALETVATRIVGTTDPSFRSMDLDRRRIAVVVVVLEIGILGCNARLAHEVDALASMRIGER